MAFVGGLQGNDPNYFRTIATPKHFAVHSGPESTRHSANVDPSRHDLWDTYLPAFRATITEAKADSTMCAYNALDGSPACASQELLGDILRRDWKFNGFVTSDCGAIDDFYEKTAHKTSADKESAAAAGIKAGTDTNCGDTYLALGDAVKKGLVTEAEIDVLSEASVYGALPDGSVRRPGKDAVCGRAVLRGGQRRSPGARAEGSAGNRWSC